MMCMNTPMPFVVSVSRHTGSILKDTNASGYVIVLMVSMHVSSSTKAKSHFLPKLANNSIIV